MHTFDGKSCQIHHNSDMSGEVSITKKGADPSDPGLIVAARDLMNFVAEFIRYQRIAALEDASTTEILGLKKSDKR